MRAKTRYVFESAALVVPCGSPSAESNSVTRLGGGGACRSTASNGADPIEPQASTRPLMRVMPLIVGGGGLACHRCRVWPAVPPLEAFRAQQMRASGDG